MRLRNVRVEVIEATTAVLLQGAVNTYLASISPSTAAGRDREYVNVLYQAFLDHYSAMIVYTE